MYKHVKAPERFTQSHSAILCLVCGVVSAVIGWLKANCLHEGCFFFYLVLLFIFIPDILGGTTVVRLTQQEKGSKMVSVTAEPSHSCQPRLSSANLLG